MNDSRQNTSITGPSGAFVRPRVVLADGSSAPPRNEPYRSEADPLAERLQQAREELAHLDGVAARRKALQAEVIELERKIAEAETLEGVRIASPCTANWNAMLGDNRVRHCTSCDKDVFNVAGMTRSEATQLLRARSDAGVCIRMFRRADGTVLTADCPVGVEKKRVRRLVMIGAGAVASAASVAGGLWAWQEFVVSETLGGMAPNRLDLPSQSQFQSQTTGTPIMGTASPVMGSAFVPPPQPPTATVKVTPPVTAPKK